MGPAQNVRDRAYRLTPLSEGEGQTLEGSAAHAASAWHELWRGGSLGPAARAYAS